MEEARRGSAESAPASVPSGSRSYDTHEKLDAEERASADEEEDRPSQVKDRPRGHVGHTDEELAEMRKYDLKRVKRIMANRSSAARSKVRKLRYTNELDSRIAALNNEQRGLQEEFYAVQANIATLSKENDFLCDEIRKLADVVTTANEQSSQLKQHAHTLRMQVLYGPLAVPRTGQALQSLQGVRDAAFSLQAPPNASLSSTNAPLLSFTSAPPHVAPSLPLLNITSQGPLSSELPIPGDVPMASRIAPLAGAQLWSNTLSSSSTSSAFSSQTRTRALGPDRQLNPEDPLLLNMLQSIDLAPELNPALAAMTSDVSSQSGLFNTGSSSWVPRPSLSQLLSSRSSVGSMPADANAWNLLSLSPAAAENSSLLPIINEQRQQLRRSDGDFPLGLPEPLQGLARYPRHFSEPRERGLPDLPPHMGHR